MYSTCYVHADHILSAYGAQTKHTQKEFNTSIDLKCAIELKDRRTRRQGELGVVGYLDFLCMSAQP